MTQGKLSKELVPRDWGGIAGTLRYCQGMVMCISPPWGRPPQTWGKDRPLGKGVAGVPNVPNVNF